MSKRLPKILSPIIAAVHFAATRLPFKIAQPLMAFIMGTGGPIFIKSRNMRTNICDVFPDLDEAAREALIKTILANFGRHIGEILHTASFRDSTHGLRIDLSTPDGVTFDAKGPAIYVGAHVGSWELFPLIFKQKSQPLTVIYSQNEHPMLDTLLMDQRTQTGAMYVEKNKALRPCIQALSRGESVALLVDQRVKQGIDVDFFGRLTAISRLPALLATKFDCPVIPFEVVRMGRGHLRVVFQDAILPDGEKGKQAEGTLTQAIASNVQDSIVRNAESWFCTKTRWRPEDREKFFVQHDLPVPATQPHETAALTDR